MYTITLRLLRVSLTKDSFFHAKSRPDLAGPFVSQEIKQKPCKNTACLQTRSDINKKNNRHTFPKSWILFKSLMSRRCEVHGDFLRNKNVGSLDGEFVRLTSSLSQLVQNTKLRKADISIERGRPGCHRGHPKYQNKPTRVIQSRW